MLTNVSAIHGVQCGEEEYPAGENTPSQSVFPDCVINIHHFTEQHFIFYGPFYSMYHYINCTELHHGTCPHTS